MKKALFLCCLIFVSFSSLLATQESFEEKDGTQTKRESYSKKSTESEESYGGDITKEELLKKLKSAYKDNPSLRGKAFSVEKDGSLSFAM